VAMEIRGYTADDVHVLTDVVELANAAGQADAPWSHPTTMTILQGFLRHGWDGEIPESFAAYDRDRLVGYTEIYVSEWDNPHLAWCHLYVHPDERRLGVGGELLEFAMERAKQLGRTSMGSDGWDSESVYAFASRQGFKRKSAAIQRRQYVDQVDADVLRTLHSQAEQAASAYDLVKIFGRTPDDLLDAVAEVSAAINDAPTDDLDIEDEVFPPERIRAYENAQLSRRQRLYRLVARHRETGQLAGQTVVAVEEARPQIGHQHDTSVIGAHRGHRLGVLLKTGMLTWLAEKESRLKTVDTWNAESNDHMIAINEQLGYRKMGRGIQFQRDL
jgi:GNAT superfamily N-acetyltransferase